MRPVNINSLMRAAAVLETANSVRQDPAVTKSLGEFAADCRQAVRSGGNLAREVRESWARHS